MFGSRVHGTPLSEDRSASGASIPIPSTAPAGLWQSIDGWLARPRSPRTIVVWLTLYLAVAADGKDIVTVEHLDSDDALSAVQRAFIEAGAFQCGFCTPGFVLMTHQLLAHNPDPSDDDIRHYLSGNLCRCAAYPEIIEAVRLAARMQKQNRANPSG